MPAKVLRLRGREFRVREPPIAVLPYLQLYRKLVASEPEGLEEAEKRSKELEGVVRAILSSCVEGPVEGLGLSEQARLLSAVGELLSEELSAAEVAIFRGERGRAAGGADGPPAGPQALGAPGPGVLGAEALPDRCCPAGEGPGGGCRARGGQEHEGAGQEEEG